MVSAGVRAGSTGCLVVQADSLERNQVVVVSGEAPGSRAIVSSGLFLPDQTVVIADPKTGLRCAPDQVGEIWVSGPSVAVAYWNKPDETTLTFGAYLAETGEGPFLRTGDLGFVRESELFVTGRIKDLIVIRGQNYYPQDIELTVEQSIPGLPTGCVAAFPAEVDGEERLVVAVALNRRSLQRHGRDLVHDQEAARSAIPNSASLIENIRKAIAETHNINVHSVLLLDPGGIPKTSSGKIQRQACRMAFLSSLKTPGQGSGTSLGCTEGKPGDDQQSGEGLCRGLKSPRTWNLIS
jgi:acyl-CoA synthetase (AMP-forming)/AMP-acid ligase II